MPTTRLVVEVERVIADDAGAVLGLEPAELAVGHFGHADVEAALELHIALRLVGASARLATRAAHGELADRHQAQLLIELRARDRGRRCDARLLRRQQRRLDALLHARARRDAGLEIDEAGLRISMSCVVDEPQRLVRGAARLAVDEQLRVGRLRAHRDFAEHAAERHGSVRCSPALNDTWRVLLRSPARVRTML